MATELARQVQRDSTVESHRQAVERVILEMRARFDQPLTLHDMAEIACLSPFHFDRIFHQITGIPAVQFLYALRIETAKRLLLTTPLSVTDVCYEVGYNSIGTFTSRFTQLVGLSPRHFRHLAEKVDNSLLESLLSEAITFFKTASPSPSATGRIFMPESNESLIFVGLFPTLIPQSRPLAGTLLTAPESYRVGPVIDGQSYVFAAAFPSDNDPLTYLLPKAASLLVGVGTRPVTVNQGEADASVDVILRPLQITDPPILIALPFLLTEVSGQGWIPVK
jgi:AraC family transcriptional regulator